MRINSTLRTLALASLTLLAAGLPVDALGTSNGPISITWQTTWVRAVDATGVIDRDEAESDVVRHCNVTNRICIELQIGFVDSSGCGPDTCDDDEPGAYVYLKAETWDGTERTFQLETANYGAEASEEWFSCTTESIPWTGAPEEYTYCGTTMKSEVWDGSCLTARFSMVPSSSPEGSADALMAPEPIDAEACPHWW